MVMGRSALADWLQEPVLLNRRHDLLFGAEHGKVCSCATWCCSRIAAGEPRIEAPGTCTGDASTS